MKIKKIACLLMAFAMIWVTASCRVSDGSVTELTDPPGSQQTTPADPGSDGPSKPITTDPSEPDVSEPLPSEPDVSEPTVPDVSEPTGPADPVDPSDPSDPAEPSEPDVPVHQHSYVEDVTKATCIKDGYTTYTCACGDSYVDGKIEATGHSWSDWVTIEEPTVTATGMAGRNCTACGEAETKVLDKVIPDHTHSYTGKVTTAATCTKEGVKTYTCSCGSSYTESIAKASHSYKATVTAPTCTDKGYTTHKCSACGNSYKDTYVAATGHSYGTYKADGNATCTKDGTKTAKCTACSVTSTVTDTGSATGHSFGSYKSNGNATCTADGTKTATCSKCGSKDTVTDAGTAKGHSYAATVTAPTCTAQGYTLHKCSACGDSYKDSYTPTIDHSYVLTDTRYPTTPMLPGSYLYKCENCDSTRKEGFYMTEDEEQAWCREAAKAMLKYINQFRVDQGDTEAISLPVLTLIAEERAVQLQDKFEHNITSSREIFAKYQYGEWVDGSSWGGSQYYSPNAKEAITKANIAYSPDELGYTLANALHNSKNHWAYVGSSDFPYMAIGIEFDGEYFNCCVLQTANNYG